MPPSANINAKSKLYVLGIEASCDDSAAAIVELDGARGLILAEEIAGQAALHADFGGVVPEIAARAHAERLDQVTGAVNPDWASIDLIAVTTGPGLIGGLHAANAFARAIAAAHNVPLIGVNHLAGHALTPMLTDGIEPPYLTLLISGGHCQFLIVHDTDRFERLGATIDDSPGEAFDKIAKILGLGYPGGPEIEREARNGDPSHYALPRPLLDRDDCNFSFSGLKTTARRIIDAAKSERGGMTRLERADLCASFQSAIAEIIAEKSRKAMRVFAVQYPGHKPVFTIAGGVAANQEIRARLEVALGEFDARLIAPPLRLCTDNAAMIAFAGGLKYQHNDIDPDDLRPRPRWPLDNTATPLIGSGKKGAKV